MGDSEGSRAARGGSGGGGGGEGAAPPPPLHARSFKLRFAAQREPGRSYVSLVRPLGLPATVTGKFYRREEAAPVDDEPTRRALRRIRDMFARDQHQRGEPLTSSQEYGRHGHGAGGAGGARDPRLDHRIRDSAWLKERLRVLAADDKLKQR